ncbi:hypothetical protein PG989_014175 [Apiospora arundinis]
MAGESKPGKKWYPHRPINDDKKPPAEDQNRPGITEENWKKPIKQILGYSDELECRHSFIITEKELVVYEFEKETGPAPSTSSPERPSSGSSYTPSDKAVYSGDEPTEGVEHDRRSSKKR